MVTSIPAMKAEQDAILAIERRASDIAQFIEDGKVRADALDQVARLAGYMAGQLPDLGPEEQRLILAMMGGTAVLDDPSDRRSLFTISFCEGPAVILDQLSAGEHPPKGCRAGCGG
jgi:hypothetical protein